jgi:hypothetical protein
MASAGHSILVGDNSSNWPNGSRLSLAPSGVWHGFPSIAGSSAVVKVIWMDNRATPGGNYTCTSSSTMKAAACGTFTCAAVPTEQPTGAQSRS